ncbi:Mitochondrial fission process protein 1 [Phytophthora pseudosyringae]|uniref:Mitochondrial fission process protein 1 n=1 Tax=Phytophthora pseudosyringae TaxID=221518 RepID=A0A8T1W7C4_9STRA|nr:Mitochondrial fission process protein 1 [Phytophthora pseudosyringae]
MSCGTFHVQSCGFFWFLSTVYLVHSAVVGSTRASDAVFNLVIHRPRIAGGTLTIPIDSSVRLVKGAAKEAPHNTIRLRYGHARKCLVMRASSSLEREKWLVALIQAMAAAQSLGDHVPTPTVLGSSLDFASQTATARQVPQPVKAQRESLSTLTKRVQPARTFPSPTPSSIDTVSSSADRLDADFIPVLERPFSSTASAVSPIDMVDPHTSSVDRAERSHKRHSHRRRARDSLSIAMQFLTTIGLGLATS